MKKAPPRRSGRGASGLQRSRSERGMGRSPIETAARPARGGPRVIYFLASASLSAFSITFLNLPNGCAPLMK